MCWVNPAVYQPITAFIKHFYVIIYVILGNVDLSGLIMIDQKFYLTGLLNITKSPIQSEQPHLTYDQQILYNIHLLVKKDVFLSLSTPKPNGHSKMLNQ